MATERQTDLDRKLAAIIGHLLRIGVITAAAIVLTGGVLYLADNAFTTPDYHTFHEASTYSRTLSGIWQNALALNSYGIIQLGLLVLVATPVMRVIFSIVVFALERDLLYVTATVIVLGVLLYSFLVRGM
jgi:uncharacterized membrane protein